MSSLSEPYLTSMVLNEKLKSYQTVYEHNGFRFTFSNKADLTSKSTLVFLIEWRRVFVASFHALIWFNSFRTVVQGLYHQLCKKKRKVCKGKYKRGYKLEWLNDRKKGYPKASCIHLVNHTHIHVDSDTKAQHPPDVFQETIFVAIGTFFVVHPITATDSY